MNNDLYPPIQWDFILDKIESEECLIVVGPELFRHNEQQLQQLLLEKLNVSQNPNITRYYSDEEFFLFDDPYKRTLLCHQIKSFYGQFAPDSTLLQLAQIPFHLFTTVTPDTLLVQAFEKQQFPNQFQFYKKNTEAADIKTPTKQLPLIYNLFGCINSEESLILTHNDLYDYFKSIFTRKSIPEKLKLQLQSVKNIILLGIPFDKWYIQLLLRELEIHNQQQYQFTRFAINQTLTNEIQTFCYDQFRINFISRNITEFVTELYYRCQQRGLLRTVGGGALSPLDKAKQHVAKGELERAIEILEDVLQSKDLENDILTLSGRYRNLKRRKNSGILREEEANVQENQIITALLELIDEANKTQ